MGKEKKRTSVVCGGCYIFDGHEAVILQNFTPFRTMLIPIIRVPGHLL